MLVKSSTTLFKEFLKLSSGKVVIATKPLETNDPTW